MTEHLHALEITRKARKKAKGALRREREAAQVADRKARRAFAKVGEEPGPQGAQVAVPEPAVEVEPEQVAVPEPAVEVEPEQVAVPEHAVEVEPAAG